VQTLLTKVVDLGDASCFVAKSVMGQLNTKLSGEVYCTDDSQRGYDTSDIHLSAGGPRPFGVPARRFWVRMANGDNGELQSGF
jgi:hypothetical protein